MIWAIIIGGIAGLIASKFTGNDAEMGWIANIIVGIVGGFLGSWIFSILGLSTSGNVLWQALIGIVGSIILLLIYNTITGKGGRRL